MHLIQVRDDSGDWTSVITEDAMKVARFRIHFEVRVDVLINGMRVLGKEGIKDDCKVFDLGNRKSMPGSLDSLINKN